MEEQGGDLVILQSLIAEHGVEQVLAPQWHSHIERMRQNHIAHFPLCLLAKLLSFTENGDIFNVIQVCHKWYAAFKLPTFWEPRIEKLLLSTKSVLSETVNVKDITLLLTCMDNFGLENESHQSRCAWITNRNVRIQLISNGCIFERPYERAQTVQYVVQYGRISQYSIRPCAFYGKEKMSGEEHLFENYSYGVQYVCLLWKKSIMVKHRRLCIQYRTEEEHLWNGLSTILTDKYWESLKPHGKGKWTFSDGSTFQGDAVAFDGIPHGIGVDQDGHEVEYFAGTRVASDGEQGPMKRVRL